jgi:7-cyano-7-deazaguanine synthase in queuosine biosynthesis
VVESYELSILCIKYQHSDRRTFRVESSFITSLAVPDQLFSTPFKKSAVGTCSAIHIFYPTLFWARSQNWEKRLSASSCLPIRNLIFFEIAEKIQVALKSVKNNGYLT